MEKGKKKSLRIEIVDFYETTRKKDFIEGTLHIYLIDYNIDLRGIYLKKDKKHWFLDFPYRKSIDKDTNKEVKYPVFSFTNIELKTFRSLVLKEAKDFFYKNDIFNKS